MTLINAGAARSAQAGWRQEPCAAELTVGIRIFDCQRPLNRQGVRYRHHLLHSWKGQVDGCQTEITWTDGTGVAP